MRLRRFLLAGWGVLALGSPAGPAAAAPEQLDQLEPGQGIWQGEYSSMFGHGDESEHSVEAMFGIGERLALGIELEAERSDGRIALETVGAKLLYRLTPDDATVGAGFQVQLGFDRHAALTETEVRFIAETKKGRWWGQANLMVRRSSDGSGSELGGAYAWSAQRSIAGIAWMGIEGSGQRRLSCGSAHCDESGHYVGPSLTMELEFGRSREAEIGIALLGRVSGAGPRSSPRLFAQFSF